MKLCIHAGEKKKRHICVHMQVHKRKGACMLENYVLVHGILVLVCGIWSEVLTPGIGSKVLFLYGFGPWY